MTLRAFNLASTSRASRAERNMRSSFGVITTSPGFSIANNAVPSGRSESGCSSTTAAPKVRTGARFVQYPSHPRPFSVVRPVDQERVGAAAAIGPRSRRRQWQARTRALNFNDFCVNKIRYENYLGPESVGTQYLSLRQLACFQLPPFPRDAPHKARIPAVSWHNPVTATTCTAGHPSAWEGRRRVGTDRERSSPRQPAR